MKNLAKFSVDRAVTVFMAVIIVIVFGVVSYTNLTTDLFPNMNLPYSVVVTTYPGASPTEVEDVVTNPLEDALATTTNVKEITSMSQENFSLIILEFNGDTNMDSAIIEMRETIDMSTASMPDMVGSSMIIKLNPDMMPIMQLSVSKGDLNQRELTEYVYDEIVPNIEKVPGVASVSISGAYESEIQVVIDEAILAEKNNEIDAINAQFIAMLGVDAPQLPLLDKELIGQILQAQNFEYPVGYANIADTEYSDGIYLVRVGDEFGTTDEIEHLTVFTFPGMLNPAYNPEIHPIEMMYVINPLEIGMNEITDIDFVNANEKEYSKVNGDNAISISIQKSSEYATTDVTKEIIAVLEGLSETDTDTDFTVLLDQGEYIGFATGSVVNNLVYGAILAVIVLIIFLRSARATFIVGISIPISLMFAIVLIYFSGITLNIVSLGGLALGIGMLVDNSIVVMENIFRMKKLGYSNRDAAIEGTKQVAGAIFASTITTISVFVPVVFIEGFIKEIFMEMALTIAYSLIASLLIALTLVPAISSKILKEDEKTVSKEESDSGWAKRNYEKLFNFAFRFKYVVMVLVVILFGGFIFLAINNGFEYFPTSDEGQLNISISNPTENPLDTDEFFAVLDDLADDILEFDDVDIVGMTLGSAQGGFLGFSSAGSASASVVLSDDRVKSTNEMEVLLNELLMDDYDMIEFDISGSQQQTSMLTGSGYQVELRGYDLEVLKTEANEIAGLLSDVEGVLEVDNGVGIPADEIKITVDKDKAVQYGYMTAVVAVQIMELLSSEEVVTTITQGGTMYDVYVYDSSSNYSDTTLSVQEIKDTILGMGFDGSFIKVSDVADVEVIEGFSTINHINGIRSLTISATFDPDFNTTFVAQDLDEAMSDYEAPEGYVFEVQGENEEIMEALSTLVLAMVLAVALIYMIMASQFQSYSYPLIIMFTIPLAFTGGFAILFFTGMPVSVVAMIGFIILVGVVVNNGIVLVDYTNQLRAKGLGVKEALLEAGKTRLRPIVMTALTTILALITMALGVGDGAEMMQPMAVTTIGGLLYATVLTLVVVPIMYFLFTEYTKNILSGLGIVAVLAGTVGAYIYLGYWYIILIGVVLLVLLLANLFFNKKKVI
ncbi:Swarming motility protein SwrC [Candidatus Izimaplasma bacterium HR1]|jgi:HAE1 family hydrophobic/amphiphilic exporter-1|uniref:efflux RND transporter permease subunit n=1 Tax=Candidatus Izimoplasma sp. HR1 TaxID=1541959 RepID=UPI0004F87DB5|nr:Swarming motility protein SwrC [Candidatus Izimaplasma bacterium HR1]